MVLETSRGVAVAILLLEIDVVVAALRTGETEL